MLTCMDGTDRPVLLCLVAYDALPYALMVRRKPVPLDEAVEWQRAGWHVLVDPETEEALVRYEQAQRAMRKPTWFGRG